MNLDGSESKYIYFENYISMLDNFVKYLDDKNLMDLREYFRKLKNDVT